MRLKCCTGEWILAPLPNWRLPKFSNQGTFPQIKKSDGYIDGWTHALMAGCSDGVMDSIWKSASVRVFFSFVLEGLVVCSLTPSVTIMVIGIKASLQHFAHFVHLVLLNEVHELPQVGLHISHRQKGYYTGTNKKTWDKRTEVHPRIFKKDWHKIRDMGGESPESNIIRWCRIELKCADKKEQIEGRIEETWREGWTAEDMTGPRVWSGFSFCAALSAFFPGHVIKIDKRAAPKGKGENGERRMREQKNMGTKVTTIIIRWGGNERKYGPGGRFNVIVVMHLITKKHILFSFFHFESSVSQHPCCLLNLTRFPGWAWLANLSSHHYPTVLSKRLLHWKSWKMCSFFNTISHSELHKHAAS